MSDEGFHEIQLNGKQLVFLFMAVTVASVVIFLLGVMVGRGVPTARAQVAEAAEDVTIDPTAVVQTTGTPAQVSSDRPPVSTQESLTYAERLEAPTPPRETLDTTAPAPEPLPPPIAAPPTPRPADAVAAKKTPAVAPAAAPTVAASFAEPNGNGHAVQVGAYDLQTAETIARRLASKGYPVFIAPRPQGLFAVRVGKYADKREADGVSDRLAKQEQFKPWVTR